MAEEVLRVLSWPGYVSRDTVRSFEARYKVRVEVSVISSDEELWDRVSNHNAANFDVMAVNTAELKRYIDAKLVVPVQPERIPNTRNQLPRFRKLAEIPGLKSGNDIYAIPYTYSAMGLIYSRKLVSPAPTSMSALWDPRYRGKVLLFNSSSHNFSLTALTLGIRDPFHLDNAQFSQVLKRLVALRDNAPKFYSRPEEVVDMFRERSAALAFGNYGDQQLRLLKQAGIDVGYVIPDEGALAWLDCWAITRGAQNRTLAEAWIDHMLTPAVSGQLTETQGLANTLQDAQAPSMRERDKLVWLQPVEDVDKRTQYWERILSGIPHPR